MSTALSRFAPHIRTKKSSETKKQFRRYKKLPPSDIVLIGSFEDDLFSVAKKFYALPEEIMKRAVAIDDNGKIHALVKALYKVYFGVQSQNNGHLSTPATCYPFTGIDPASLLVSSDKASTLASGPTAGNDNAVKAEEDSERTLDAQLSPSPDLSVFAAICHGMGAAGGEVKDYYVKSAWRFVKDINMELYRERIDRILLVLRKETDRTSAPRTYCPSAAMTYGAVHWQAYATADQIDLRCAWTVEGVQSGSRTYDPGQAYRFHYPRSSPSAW